MAGIAEISPTIVRPPGLDLAKQWHVYEPSDLVIRIEELGGEEYIVEGLIPRQSLGILVGQSGSGKSPLLYQLGICVAAGVPFLGHRVKQGPVLYMDNENGLKQVSKMQERLSRHLGLSAIPSGLLFWGRNDADLKWGEKGHGFAELIETVRPSLVIIDTLSAQFPQAEAKNENANSVINIVRGLARKCRTSFLFVHHLRKPNDETGAVRLEDGDLNAYFNQVRGASSLINGCDFRLAIESPFNNENVALVVRGYARLSGEIPLIRLARVRDDEGEPVGYSKVSGPALLGNPEQRAAFDKLPPVFKFTEAKFIYGRGPQATNDFLQNCISAGLLLKATKRYEKIDQPSQDETGGSSGLGG